MGIGGSDDRFGTDPLARLVFGAPLAESYAMTEAVTIYQADVISFVDRLEETAGDGDAIGCAGVERDAEILIGETVSRSAQIGDDKSRRPPPLIRELHVHAHHLGDLPLGALMVRGPGANPPG